MSASINTYIPANAPHDPRCNPEYPISSNLPLEYEFQPAAYNPADDVIILKDTSGPRTYLRELSQPNTFCRFRDTEIVQKEYITIFEGGFRLQISDTASNSCFTQEYNDSTAAAQPQSTTLPMNLEECNALPDIDLRVVLVEDYHRLPGSGESGEELYCEYAAVLTNPTERSIKPFFYLDYKYDTNVQTEWLGLPMIEPGQSASRSSQVHQYPNSVYGKKDYDVARRIGAYYDDPACSFIREDPDLMEMLSLPIIPPCESIFPP